MAEPNEDEFFYGPVADDPPRKPLRHRDPWRPDRSGLGQPKADLRPVITDPRMQNRGTEKEEPDRAIGEQNRSVKSPTRILPPSDRGKSISFEELKKGIDEEEANRLNPMDGYSAVPPRP